MKGLRKEDRIYYHLKHPARRRSENKRIRAAIMAAGCHVYDVAGRLGIGEGTLYRWLRWELPEEKFLLIMEAIAYEAALRGKSFPEIMVDVKKLPWEKEKSQNTCEVCDGCIGEECDDYKTCSRPCGASRGPAGDVGRRPVEPEGHGERKG